MPPQVTETWASAYLQVLIVLLVFALGIPAILFKMDVPEKIRAIMNRHGMFKWLFRLMILLTIACLSFIWLFHACSGASLSAWQNYISSIIVTMLLIFIVLTWWFILRGNLIERLVSHLENDLSIFFARERTIDDDTLAELNDLVDLGEQGNAGDEKEIVLDALNRLAANVQSAKGYQGVELEELIRGTERVVGNREKPGNDRNFSLAGDILKGIRQRANENRAPSYLDADLALKGLGRLGIMAIDRRSEAVAQGFLEALSGNSQKVFEMGRAAFQANYFLLALAALSRLETLAEKPGPGNVNTSTLLGLIAYFQAAGGSARQRAELSLSQSPEIFSPSLPACLRQAYDYYYFMPDYETADKLLALMAEATG